MSDSHPRRWLLIHSSDEMYGSDRVLLQTIQAIGIENIVECWLPVDIDYPGHALCAEMQRRGLKVRHLDYPVLRREYQNMIGVRRIIRRWFHANRLVRQASHSRANAVYLATSAAITLAPLFRLRGYWTVLHIHEMWGRSERLVFRWLLPFVNRQIAVSEAVAFNVPGATTVIYNGFPDMESTESGGTWASKGDHIEFLLASRWSTWKGHEDFLRAWAATRREDAFLTILGGPPPSGEAVDIPSLVKELGIVDSVSVVGESAIVERFIDRCDVVVVPSRRPDPLPTIAIEAARAGRAVIASNCGGLPEIVEDGVTGFLIEPGDISAWAAAIDQITVESAYDSGPSGAKPLRDPVH